MNVGKYLKLSGFISSCQVEHMPGIANNHGGKGKWGPHCRGNDRTLVGTLVGTTSMIMGGRVLRL